MFKFMTNFFKNLKVELHHVNWPKQSHVIFLTALVIILSALIAYLLGFFDMIFTKGLEKLIGF